MDHRFVEEDSSEHLQDGLPMGVMYKVRWKGYNSDDDTWEHPFALTRCQALIDEYLRGL